MLNINGILAFNYTDYSQDKTFFTNISSKNLSNKSIVKVVDINPYKNKKLDKLKINNQKVKFGESINDRLKIKLNQLDKDESEYVLMRFNKNPSKNEIRKLRKEGIQILDYVGSNSYYVKISKKFDDILEIKDNSLKLKSKNVNDKYIIRNINDNNYKLTSSSG